ncbi:hypothetical protein NKR23_g12562 [Pleurostoma richardsiae]|uniref:Uncharacterized protein n=1 Tax=Pleurostoma richardsiae TaxID=41990 RepID=A0AA38VF81_9PEZI|nr:hypothetical protein NKR23_g12562 [Pleurostoma richardsiae]
MWSKIKGQAATRLPSVVTQPIKHRYIIGRRASLAPMVARRLRDLSVLQLLGDVCSCHLFARYTVLYLFMSPRGRTLFRHGDVTRIGTDH